MERRERFTGFGALLIGSVLILVGGYYVLRNNLGVELGPLDGDLIWPAIVVILGLLVIVRSIRRTETPA
jgi:uncharacterized integral membrane protein